VWRPEQDVPDQIKQWDLVGDHFNGEQHTRAADDPPAFEHAEVAGKIEHTKSREQAKDRHRAGHVQSGGETDRNQERDDFARIEGHVWNLSEKDVGCLFLLTPRSKKDTRRHCRRTVR
jgi:hypothetical protein